MAWYLVFHKNGDNGDNAASQWWNGCLRCLRMAGIARTKALTCCLRCLPCRSPLLRAPAPMPSRIAMTRTGAHGRRRSDEHPQPLMGGF